MMLRRFAPITAALVLTAVAATAGAQPKSGRDPGMMAGQGMMGYGMMGRGMMGMGMMARYPNGYLAFLKTEIGINAKQEKAWDTFAKALKEQAAAMQSHRAAMHGRRAGHMARGSRMGPGMKGYGNGQSTPLPEALDQRIQAEQARIESLKALRDAAGPLYATLSDEQKAKANQLLGGMGGCWR